MKAPADLSGRERGAILVHVAVALLMLMALSAFALDLGLFWLSRREAQNAADAGALAGAVALAFDDAADRTDSGPAKRSALTAALRNRVWGEPPAVNIASDITFPVCPDGTSTCIRVNVFRDSTHFNALPMFVGGLVGLSAQGTRAMAIAQARAANASYCLKPWIIPDKWEEHYPTPAPAPWDAETSTFDTTIGNGANTQPLADPDQYRPPTAPDMTGFRATGTPNDIGLVLMLKAGPPSQQSGGGAVQPGWVYPVRLNDAESGGAVYREDIQFCSGDLVRIGDFLRNETGIMVGPTFQGVDPLIASDPGAHWVDPDGPGGVPGRVAGSCMDTASCPPPYSPSPTRSARLAAVPVFNTATFSQTPGAEWFEVVNIIGIFIEARDGNTIRGILTGFAGQAAAGGSQIENSAAFSHTVVLVR